MVGGGERAIGPTDLPAGQPQRLERLRRGHPCTSWRSTYSTAGATSCASQILSNRSRSHRLAPPQARGHDGVEARPAGAGILEVMGKVGVEGHGVPVAPCRRRFRRRRVRRASSVTTAVFSGLPGFVHRRVPDRRWRPRGRARGGRPPRASGQRRREDLVAVLCAAAATLAGSHHGHAVGLVEAQQLRQVELESCRDPLTHGERGSSRPARPGRSSARRPRALRQVTQRAASPRAACAAADRTRDR